MKKCPECGNPSYDGAPVCGNCGYTFPKPKAVAPKREDIFQKPPKLEKSSDKKSTWTILKEKKLLIGAILLITLLVIFGIFLSGSNNTTSPIKNNDLNTYNEGGFSFKYPGSWEEINLTDSDHSGAKFFQTNNTTIEYYNVTTESSSLKEINQERISVAQESGDYVELLETVTLDGRNAANMILENADGDYTRYVSMFSDGELYVFKITGDSFNAVTSQDIDSVINTANIA